VPQVSGTPAAAAGPTPNPVFRPGAPVLVAGATAIWAPAPAPFAARPDHPADDLSGGADQAPTRLSVASINAYERAA
jgi:hypothetical protein